MQIAHFLMRTSVWTLLVLTAGKIEVRCEAAEPIKIGLVKAIGGGPVYIAQEKGYFTTEGVPAEIVYFAASQPIALAVASGSIDFGITGFTAGFYSLAGQGALKIIAGNSREAPGFRNLAYIVSNQAYAAGFTSLKNFPGHSIAISQVGSPPHYALGLLIEKYSLDAQRIRVLPLQSITNMVSAVKGGQADATILTATASLPLIAGGAGKLLGWVGDETPWQLGAVFTATTTANNRRDLVERFLRAHRRATHMFHDAFADKDGKPRVGAAAPEIFAIITKYTGLAPETIERGLPYFDAEARLDVKDVLHQIEWYKSQGVLKPEINGERIIDSRYLIPLQEH